MFYWIKKKYRKIKSLYHEIEKVNKNRYNCLILCIICTYQTVKTLLKACFTKRKKDVEYVYYFHDVKYKILLNNNLRPIERLFEAHDEKDKDITDLIRMYAGPFEDFHNMRITPKILKLEKVKLKVLKDDLDVDFKEYNENDVIVI